MSIDVQEYRRRDRDLGKGEFVRYAVEDATGNYYGEIDCDSVVVACDLRDELKDGHWADGIPPYRIVRRVYRLVGEEVL